MSVNNNQVILEGGRTWNGRLQVRKTWRWQMWMGRTCTGRTCNPNSYLTWTESERITYKLFFVTMPVHRARSFATALTHSIKLHTAYRLSFAPLLRTSLTDYTFYLDALVIQPLTYIWPNNLTPIHHINYRIVMRRLTIILQQFKWWLHFECCV